MTTAAAICPEDVELMTNQLASFVHDPLGAVLYGMPWGEGDLETVEGPRKWQREVMEFVGAWFRGELQGEDLERFGSDTRFKVCRVAISSGHGPGKSTLAAFLAWWGMSTSIDCRVNVTANTKGQLDTKTQPEFSTWFGKALNADWWNVHIESIKYNETRKDEASWRCDFVPWSESNPQAVAGLHNARKRLILIFDESSEIADVIRDTAQGALTDAYTEILWLALGNPTRNVGWFYDAVFGKERYRWKTWIIDSRDVEGTNREEIQSWLKECNDNEDADYFRVRARGLPPRAGSAQFIDLERIAKAQKRAPRALSDDALVAGVDFAWGGEDNNRVHFRRGFDGRTIPSIYIKGEFTRDPAVMVGKLVDVLTSWYVCDDGVRRRVDMLFFDSAGIAAPVEARLRALGYGERIMVVNFGADSPKPHCAYFRDFMWDEMKQWLLEGAIPADPELEADLSGPMLVSERNQRIKLESKDVMKARLKRLGKPGKSPDWGDALALTFAHPVLPKKESKPSDPLPPRNDGAGWMA
jgi:hypothetical protein